jgi:hypothetical protein
MAIHRRRVVSSSDSDQPALPNTVKFPAPRDVQLLSGTSCSLPQSHLAFVFHMGLRRHATAMGSASSQSKAYSTSGEKSKSHWAALIRRRAEACSSLRKRFSRSVQRLRFCPRTSFCAHLIRQRALKGTREIWSGPRQSVRLLASARRASSSSLSQNARGIR